MTPTLQQIIKTSTFETQPGIYQYLKIKKVNDLGKHFFVSKDDDETTIVTRKEYAGKIDLIEKNKDYWRLIALNNSSPFYSVGFLATVSSSIAKAGMNVLIISTYSKDYIMVRRQNFPKIIQILKKLGFKINKN